MGARAKPFGDGRPTWPRAAVSGTATAVAILLLTACSPPPPIVSADTSCERFAHISATDAQIKVFQDNWDVMETYADQVVEHNVTFDKSCLGPVKP